MLIHVLVRPGLVGKGESVQQRNQASRQAGEQASGQAGKRQGFLCRAGLRRNVHGGFSAASRLGQRSFVFLPGDKRATKQPRCEKATPISSNFQGTKCQKQTGALPLFLCVSVSVALCGFHG